MVGIVDEALAQGGEDAHKISSYKDALTDFIKRMKKIMAIKRLTIIIRKTIFICY